MPIPEELKEYAARLGFAGSETMGEILALLFPDEESRKIAQSLHRPATFGDIAAVTGIPLNRVEAVAERLVRGGVVGRYIEPRDKIKLFGAMIELRDASIISPEASAELAHLWERLITEDLRQVVPVWQRLEMPALLRVVPIEETVPAQNLILDIDSARQILREAELIAASPCPCRVQARQVGKGHDCPAPKDVNLCLQINLFAQHALERGVGESISNEEALRRIGMAEDAGLVHQVRNNVKKDMLMCNCCSCCCTGLYMIDKLGYNAYAKSRFQVEFETSTCKGCGKCVQRCQFKAITIDKSIPVKERVAEIDFDKCYGCGYCVATCPTKSLTLKEVRPREFVRTT
ncbi:MAG: ATP-binding protein [Methylocystaceae bacterium]